MGTNQTCSGQAVPEQMATGQINLKEMGHKQTGSGQMGPTKLKVLRNGFCIQY